MNYEFVSLATTTELLASAIELIQANWSIPTLLIVIPLGIYLINKVIGLFKRHTK